MSNYAKERQAFGKSISSYGQVSNVVSFKSMK